MRQAMDRRILKSSKVSGDADSEQDICIPAIYVKVVTLDWTCQYKQTKFSEPLLLPWSFPPIQRRSPLPPPPPPFPLLASRGTASASQKESTLTKPGKLFCVFSRFRINWYIFTSSSALPSRGSEALEKRNWRTKNFFAARNSLKWRGGQVIWLLHHHFNKNRLWSKACGIDNLLNLNYMKQKGIWIPPQSEFMVVVIILPANCSPPQYQQQLSRFLDLRFAGKKGGFLCLAPQGYWHRCSSWSPILRARGGLVNKVRALQWDPEAGGGGVFIVRPPTWAPMGTGTLWGAKLAKILSNRPFSSSDLQRGRDLQWGHQG